MEIIIKERMGERGREKSQQQNKEQRRAMEGVKKMDNYTAFLNRCCLWRQYDVRMERAHTTHARLFV